MLNDIGSKQQGVFVDGISLATEAIKHYELFANALLAIAAAYGTYKAILAAVVVIQKAQALADNIRLVMMFRKELGLLTAAQQAFNITAWANPYVLLAAAIVGVATALYLYADTASNAEKAQEKLNEQKDEFQKKLDEEAQKVNELISIIQDKTETDYAQLKAYEELKKVCPAITDAYTQEKLAALELTEVRKALNEEMERKTYENAQQNLQRYTWLLSEASQAEGNWTKMSKEAQDAIRNELGTGLLKNKVEQLKDVVKGYQEQVDEIERVKKEAEEKAKPIETKIVEAKADLEQIQKEFDKAKAKLEEEQAKTKKQFGEQVMTFFYEIKFRMAQGNLKKAQDREHILEGLARAIDIVDEIIATIRACKGGTPEAKAAKKPHRLPTSRITMQRQRLGNKPRRNLIQLNGTRQNIPKSSTRMLPMQKKKPVKPTRTWAVKSPPQNRTRAQPTKPSVTVRNTQRKWRISSV